MNETFFFFWFWLIFLLPFQVTSRQAVLSMLDTTRQRASDREVIYDNEMNTTWLNEEAQSDAEHRELSVCLPTFTKPFERTESFRRADYAEDSDSKKCTWIFFRLEASIRYARYYIFLFPFAWPAAHARNLYTDRHTLMMICDFEYFNFSSLIPSFVGSLPLSLFDSLLLHVSQSRH